LRQFSNREFHRALDRDSSNALVLINPCVCREVFLSFFVQGLQFLYAFLGARFLVIAGARRRSDYREHNEAKQNENEYNSQPCREWRARVGNAAN
jgi:hypothetical protein